jgi:ubiquinone/menaquinone biosynthesis C-methylase UbiE
MAGHRRVTGSMSAERAEHASGVLEREQRHFDDLADTLEAAAMPPRPPDEWEQALLSRIGDVSGRRVLELGCGAGHLSLALLDRGAQLTALDLSPGMVDVARGRAARYRPDSTAEFIVAPVEDTGLPAGRFDLVVGKWILHHVDLDRGAREVARVLRDGGRGVFAETSGLNPLLRVARRRFVGRWGVARYGTADEHPIEEADLRVLERHFSSVEVDAPVFWLVQMVDRHLLKWRYPRATRACRRIDAALVRALPSIRRHSYWIVVDVRR